MQLLVALGRIAYTHCSIDAAFTPPGEYAGMIRAWQRYDCVSYYCDNLLLYATNLQHAALEAAYCYRSLDLAWWYVYAGHTGAKTDEPIAVLFKRKHISCAHGTVY